jgi:hypothetical protein
MKNLVSPILVVVIGTAWLLNALDVLPHLDWVWTVGLAAAGILTLVQGGLNRLTAVIGPFLLTASVFSILRQTGCISLKHELPSLTIAVGAYWLLGCLLKLPVPQSLLSDETSRE